MTERPPIPYGDDPAVDPLSQADAADLARLEASVTSVPWSESQYRDGFTAGNFGWGWYVPAGDRGQKCIGFALFNQVLDEATLLNLVIDPAWRRRQLAKRLLQRSLANLAERGARTVFLEVRVGNGAAIELYRQLGFVDTGVRRGYYPADPPLPRSGPTHPQGGREDALTMQRRCTDEW